MILMNLNFEQFIIPIISFFELFAKEIKICSMSALHAIGVILFAKS